MDMAYTVMSRGLSMGRDSPSGGTVPERCPVWTCLSRAAEGDPRCIDSNE
jgi:hypothetical protein